jgi:hypothetical protein
MRRYTEVGRVVYTRKPHLFTARDLARIARSMDTPDTFSEYFDTARILVEVIFKLFQSLLEKHPLWQYRNQFVSFWVDMISYAWGFLSNAEVYPKEETSSP